MPVDLVPDDDAVPFGPVVGFAPALDDVDEGGATAARALTVDQVAAELAPVLPCVYGRKDTAPLLASWTSDVIPAK